MARKQSKNRLTLLEKLDRVEHGCRFGLFLCKCGIKKEIPIKEVSKGHIKSCGCLKKELNHGQSKKQTWQIWRAMLRRCYCDKHMKYDRYGGRGISVCDRWKESYDNFLADMGEVTEGLTLERIDNDGNYCPENCKWATWTEQRNNTSRCKFIEYNGKKQTRIQWERELGFKEGKLESLINKMSLEEAIIYIQTPKVPKIKTNKTICRRKLIGCRWIPEKSYNSYYCNKECCEEFPTLCKEHYTRAKELNSLDYFKNTPKIKTPV